VSQQHTTLTEQDIEARRAAQATFSHPIVLEAGAGTGKTSALVARVIAWCLGEGWQRSRSAFVSVGVEDPPAERIAVRTLSRVVAITFTEAAAEEMRARVGDALKLIKKGELPDGLYRDGLPSEESVLIRRTGALVSAFDHLLVRTIHAFCRRLLSRYPLEAGLHPAFDVDADETRLEEVVRAVVLARTHEALSEPVDPDFRRLFALGYQPQQLFSTLHRLAADAAPQDILARDPLGEGAVLALAERVMAACADLVLAVGSRLDGAQRSPGSQDVIRACALMHARLKDMLREDSDVALSLERIRQWAELFKPASVARLKAWGRSRFNQTEGACLEEVAVPLGAASLRLHGLLRHLERINPEHLDLARRVLHPMLVEVHRRVRAAGIESFSALLVDARNLLARRADVRATIQSSIDQLLVDEFQDTDALQCDVVRLLALRGEEPPGLFIVGDPKQSIYGWRNADLRAYDAFVGEVVAAGGTRHALSVNFRSVPAILEEVSQVIVPIMLEQAGLQPAFQPLIPSRDAQDGVVAAGRTAVEYWNAWAWDGEEPQPGKTRSEDATELEAAAIGA
jgi:ATP-dependent helicase/nuclease subunit A